MYEVLADTGLLAIAYYAAFRLRFQGADFDVFFPPFVRSLPIVIGLQVAGLYLTGKYRQVWRSVSAAELGTLIKGLALGLTGSVLFVLFVFRFERFSRGVFVIDALVAWFLLVGARAVTSGIDSYLRKVRVRGRRVLVYGAGRGGTLLVREILQNPAAGFQPVGFIDDDPQKHRMRLEGIPVLGGGDSLEAVVMRHEIAEILISIRDIEPGRLAELLQECQRLKITLRRMRFSIDEVRMPSIVRRNQRELGRRRITAATRKTPDPLARGKAGRSAIEAPWPASARRTGGAMSASTIIVTSALKSTSGVHPSFCARLRRIANEVIDLRGTKELGILLDARFPVEPRRARTRPPPARGPNGSRRSRRHSRPAASCWSINHIART